MRSASRSAVCVDITRSSPCRSGTRSNRPRYNGSRCERSARRTPAREMHERRDMTWAIGVDIGGTFTDCVAIDTEGGLHDAKAISTHHTDVAEGVLDALDELAREAGK